jgi:hypothetical protein
MKPPLVFSGFHRGKAAVFLLAADRPPVEVEPVERWRVFGFSLYNV